MINIMQYCPLVRQHDTVMCGLDIPEDLLYELGYKHILPIHDVYMHNEYDYITIEEKDLPGKWKSPLHYLYELRNEDIDFDELCSIVHHEHYEDLVYYSSLTLDLTKYQSFFKVYDMMFSKKHIFDKWHHPRYKLINAIGSMT